MSLIRENILKDNNYTPYCGSNNCYLTWPRTKFDGEQFVCDCGWRSAFEKEFIDIVNKQRNASR